MSAIDDLTAAAKSPSLSHIDELAGQVSERPNQEGVSNIDQLLGTAGAPPELKPTAPAKSGPFTPSFEPSPAGTATQEVAAPPSDAELGAPVTTLSGAAQESAKNLVMVPGAVALGVGGAMFDVASNPLQTLRESFHKGLNNIQDAVTSWMTTGKTGTLDALKPVSNPVPIDSPEDQTIASAMQSLDIPRIAGANAMAIDKGYTGLTNGPDSVWGKIGLTGVKAFSALMDFTLLNKLTESAAKYSKEAYAGSPELQVADAPIETPFGRVTPDGSMVNLLANIPKEFMAPLATDLAVGTVPAEALLIGPARLLSKALTNVEAAMPAALRATAAGKAYSAAVEFGQQSVSKMAFKALDIAPKPGLSEVGTEIASNALEANLQAAATTTKPLGLKRVLDQTILALDGVAPMPAASVSEKLKMAARQIKARVAGDMIDVVGDDIAPSILKIQQAGSVGRGKAKIAMDQLHKQIFDGAAYNVSDDLTTASGVVGNIKQYVASLTGTLPKAEKLAFAKASGLAPEQIDAAWQNAVRNQAFIHPRMELVYTEAGRSLFHAKQFMSGLVDKVNQYTQENMLALNHALVNPVMERGYVDAELVRATKAKSGDIANARLAAWDKAWAEWHTPGPDGKAPSDGFRDYLSMRLSGDPDLIDRTFKAMDVYTKHMRGVVEPMKLDMSYSLKGDLYLHHMYNKNLVEGSIGEASRVKTMMAGSKQQRTLSEMIEVPDALGGSTWVPREDAVFNLRKIMTKDLAEVHASQMHNEGLKGLFDSKAIMVVNPGKGRFNSFKNLEAKVKGAPGEAPKYVEMANYQELPLDRMDRYTMKSVLAVHPQAIERAKGQEMLKMLDASNDVVHSEDLVHDTISTDQLSQMKAIMGEKKFAVRSDLGSYLGSMRKQTDPVWKQYLDRSLAYGDSGFKRISRGFTEGGSAGKALLNTSGVVNAAIRPIAVGFDLANMSQRLSTMTRIFTEYNPGNLIEIVRRSHKMLDERDLETYATLLKNGGMYEGRVGITEAKTLADHSYLTDRLGAVGRHMQYSERITYGTDNFNSASYDMRMRIATQQWMEERMGRWYDHMASDSSIRQTYAKMQQFTHGILGDVNYKKLVRKDGSFNQIAMGQEIQSIFGSYNVASRSAAEKEIGAKLLTFYGWHRGTFWPILTAPVRSPLWAAAAPLFLADRLNYTLSGRHMWENGPGKEFSIAINPKQAWNGEDHDYYVGLPTPLVKSYGLLQGDQISKVVQAFQGQSYKDAATLGVHLVTTDIPTNIGNKYLRESMAGGTLKSLLDTEFYNKTHESDEVAYRTLRGIIATANYNAADVMDTMVKNGTSLTPELAFRTAALSAASLYAGINLSDKGPSATAARAEGRRQLGVNPQGMITQQAAMDMVKEHAQQRVGSNAGNYLPKQYIGARIGDALEDLIPDPTKREQASSILRKTMKR